MLCGCPYSPSPGITVAPAGTTETTETTDAETTPTPHPLAGTTAELDAIGAIEIVGGSPGEGIGQQLFIGDFTADGLDDLVVAGTTASYLVEGPVVADVQLGPGLDRLDYVPLVAGDFQGLGYDTVIVATGLGDVTSFDAPGGTGWLAGATTLHGVIDEAVQLVAGDLNGDGIDDFVLGVQSDTFGSPGHIRVWYDPFADPTETPDVTLFGEEDHDGFHDNPLDVVPDLDGDGVNDLIAYPSRAGAFHDWYIVRGPPISLGTLPDAADWNWDQQGGAEAWQGAGDLNGDGYNDLLTWDWVEALLDYTPLDESEGPMCGDATLRLSTIVDRADVVGDIDLDGSLDLAVSNLEEHEWTPPSFTAIVFGPIRGVVDVDTDGYVLFDATAPDGVGADTTVGDWNHDGNADLAIGVPGAAESPTGPGKVYLLFSPL